MDAPNVPGTELCNFWDVNNIRCNELTGTEPGTVGPDSDLCPEHRALMQAQRDENARAQSYG